MVIRKRLLKASLKVTTISKSKLELEMKRWGPDEISLTQFSNDITSSKLIYQISDLKHDSYHAILINNKTLKRIKSSMYGILVFDYRTNENPEEIVVLNK